MRVLQYLKAAFMNRWNLLALAGGAGAALISGNANVALPLVAAAEVAFLGFVGTHPRFQAYIDVQEASARRRTVAPPASERNERTASRILRALPVEARDRFKRLRSRLLDLREIASDMKQHAPSNAGHGLESMQLESLDKLLWIYLRLQFTQHSLSRFLERTDEQEIRGSIQRLETRLAGLDANDVSPHAAKIRATVEDNLATSRGRLENYQKAEANWEYVGLELDRLENKITSLAELTVSRQEPDLITGRVDEVARSVVDTEETINELDFVSNIGPLDERPPPLLQEAMYITD